MVRVNCIDYSGVHSLKICIFYSGIPELSICRGGGGDKERDGENKSSSFHNIYK